jgi:5,10-methylenetetrahydromethanopterin reductase
MDFGIALVSNVDAWKTVKRAEGLGFTHAWFYDTQMLAPDVFVSMALAAANTSKIKLGTGVIVPSNRIAPVCANGLASLNLLAPGRIIFGVSTGFTARNTMGLGPMKLARVREYIRVVQGLLAGETVEWEFDGKRKKIRFLNPEFGLINIRDRIPLHLSAFAAKGRRMAVEIGDGWMTFASANARAVAEIQALADDCRAAGRDPRTMFKSVFTLGCVLGDGEPCTSQRAREQGGPLATVFLHGIAEGAFEFPLPPQISPVVEAFRQQYATYQPADAKYLQLHKLHLIAVRPEEEKFLTENVMRMMTFTAGEAELRERLVELKRAGYDHFVIQLVAGHEDAIEDWARLFEKL